MRHYTATEREPKAPDEVCMASWLLLMFSCFAPLLFPLLQWYPPPLSGGIWWWSPATSDSEGLKVMSFTWMMQWAPAKPVMCLMLICRWVDAKEAFSRLDNNLEWWRDKGMKPLMGMLTRLIISKVVVKVLLGLSSRMKKWKIHC